MLSILVHNSHYQKQLDPVAGPIEFGRGEQPSEVTRCEIQHDAWVSKSHMRVEEIAETRIRVLNLSAKNPIRLADRNTIAPGASTELDLPAEVILGGTRVVIEPGETLQSVAAPILDRSTATQHRSLNQLGTAPSPETLTHWFETVIAVQRAASGSPEFYDQTARAIVDLVGLDRGLVLLRRGSRWEVVARHGTDESDKDFSLTILQSVVKNRRTYFHAPGARLSGTVMESLRGIEAVVASPVFDSQDNVIGALYGSRAWSPRTPAGGIGPLEAQVVQLLAAAVGAGLARLDQEAHTTRLRVQFEQFFSVDLARELQRNPQLLEGQLREVTILFSDIRGFSELSERIGPRDTCRLVSDVMERMTRRIREFEGAAVDYLGDGLLAMWNAPADQAEHATLACRAALAMLAEVPGLTADWEKVLGGPLNLGIGLNTGPALVGNMGSRHKFKYGPLGHAVNLASRVEGATKHLGIPLLITGSTRGRLGEAFATRRLCRVRVVGIQNPVDLYELHGETAAPEWLACRDHYETALAHYEAGQWSATCRTLYPILAHEDDQYDIPCLNLVARAVECMKFPPKEFDPVMDLQAK